MKNLKFFSIPKSVGLRLNQIACRKLKYVARKDYAQVRVSADQWSVGKGQVEQSISQHALCCIQLRKAIAAAGCTTILTSAT